MIYRKKPVEIQAVQWVGVVFDIYAFLLENPGSGKTKVRFENQSPESSGQMVVETLEGKMTANIGDFLICGVDGEFYFCKPEIFEKTYELVDRCDYCMEEGGMHQISCAEPYRFDCCGRTDGEDPCEKCIPF